MRIDKVFSLTKLKAQFQKWSYRIKHSTVHTDLRAYQSKFEAIKRWQADYAKRDDSELQAIGQSLRGRAMHRADLEMLLDEAFALTAEAVKRVLGIHPFDCQLIGGIALHHGHVIEMQTGEGKTLTAVFAAYLNALGGQGVHALTVNDYLARRDAEWMGPVYMFLGLTSGYVQEGMDSQARRDAYNADVTYLTVKEAGFDFLRDGLCYGIEEKVQRPFHFAIIDEADSILIDEARIPLVIAGTDEASKIDSDEYRIAVQMAKVARRLDPASDIAYDRYARTVHLTDQGIRHAETLLACGDLYAASNTYRLTRLNCALYAEYLLVRDVDYLIRSSSDKQAELAVELVDEFTGRVADKRQWPDGIQAALEAKESLAIQPQGMILNSIPIQYFVQHYPKLSGMTATAVTSANEFRTFYDLEIVVIPLNKLCIREDYPDVIYPTKAAKEKALIQEIVQIHQSRRPILVGTHSIADSNRLADALRAIGVSCQVLNAKQDRHEANTIAQAGCLDAITISTNMAGRGTDIRLGGDTGQDYGQVAALGGLYVIGTFRHESIRIDDQLRGRAGRQGAPGSSRFIISLEDELFTKYQLQDLIPIDIQREMEDEPITNPLVGEKINHIQRIIEGQNLEIKKTLVKYAFLVEQQRKIMMGKRTAILEGRSCQEVLPKDLKPPSITTVNESDQLELAKRISLYYLDQAWSDYLAVVADIREGIYLARVGALDPVLEFHKRIVALFDDILAQADQCILQEISRANDGSSNVNMEQFKTPSSTWTYFISDHPFEGRMKVILLQRLKQVMGSGLK